MSEELKNMIGQDSWSITNVQLNPVEDGFGQVTLYAPIPNAQVTGVSTMTGVSTITM